MKIKYFLIILISLIVAESSAADNILLEKDESLSADFFWAEIMQLSEARRLIEEGKVFDAKILLKALIEERPSFAPAVELMFKLRDRSGEGNVRISNEANVYPIKLKQLYDEYLDYLNNSEFSNARNLLLKLLSICSCDNECPPFASKLDDDLRRLEESIDKTLGSVLRESDEAMRRIDEFENANAKLEAAILIYDRLTAYFKKYPDLNSLIKRRTGLLDIIRTSARVLFAKAEIVQSLDGCNLSLPEYKRLILILKDLNISLIDNIREKIDECG